MLAMVVAGAAACARAPETRAGDSTAAPVETAAAAAPATAQPAPAPDTAVASRGTPPARARGDSAPRATPTASPTPTASETVLTGKVVAGGLAGDPVTSLQIEGGKPTTLAGPLEQELRRLGGATVWVAGAPGAAAPNASFVVSRYEIVAVDGAKPMVGSLATRDGATWLVAERDSVRLTSVPAGLSGKAGAKVWIVGRRAGAELTPQSFGVIRP